MKRRKVLIADRSEAFCAALAEILAEQFDVKTVCAGPETLETMQAYQPDLLILDLMLPGLDGITLLHKARDLELCARTIVTGSYFSDYMQTALSRLEVAYAMIRPCNVYAVAERARELLRSAAVDAPAPADPRTRIINTLLELGIPTKLNGFAYAREAILLYGQDPCQQITKTLYPQLGERFNCSALQIERSIRSAIQTAWDRRDESVWRRYFSRSECGQLQRPTNGEFISRLAALEERSLFVRVS